MNLKSPSMINYIIIDDEPKNIRVLRKMLENFCPDTCYLGEAINAKEGEELIRESQPDLLFLDIEMPFGNAFNLLDRLMPVKFEIIFVTAFDNYTLQAFKYSALDYLLKPVNIEELCAAVQRASGKLKLKDINQQLNSLFSNLRQPDAGAFKLALPNDEGLVFVTVDDIIRCEASGGYTFFYLKNGDKILACRNLREYEAILPPANFLRVHNSHIINVMCIKKYHKGRGGHIEMENNIMIEVSSRRKKEFLRRFGF
jgi:two-component system LytT family response regulator